MRGRACGRICEGQRFGMALLEKTADASEFLGTGKSPEAAPPDGERPPAPESGDADDSYRRR